MQRAHLVVFLCVLMLAVGGYALFYCFEKAKLAAGLEGTTTVGGDIIVMVYVATVSTTWMSCLAAFVLRREAFAMRALPITALLVCAGALGFWAWLHLSGIVVSYPG
jgi:hypothetical protein